MAQYGNRLQGELVQMLNNDFEQYISLSVSLQGTETLVNEIMSPLYETRSRLLSAFLVVSGECEHLKQCIADFEGNTQHKALLQQHNAREPTQGEFGGLERRARAVSRSLSGENDLGDLESALTDELSALFTADPSPRQSAAASLLRSFSACGSSQAAHLHMAESIIRPQLPNIGNRVALVKFLSSKALLGLAKRCAFFDKAGGYRYAFLRDCFFVEVVRFLLPNQTSRAIFATGVADQFHRNYSAVSGFVAQLEALDARIADCPHVTEFLQKFNLDVYFQLRLQSMVHRLEIVLAKPVPTRVLEGGEGEASKNVSAFSLEATRVIAELARSCFDDNVFIPQLAARFFALALQLVNRYTAFIEVACRRLDAGLCLLLAADIDKLLAWIESDLKCRCKSRLEGHDSEEGQEHVHDLREVIESAFKKSTSKLAACHQQLKDAAVRTVVDRCAAALDAVPRIKATYRMTGQQKPTAPLPYVQLLVQPMEQAMSEISSPDERAALGRMAIESLAERYAKACSDLLDVMRQTESSLRRLGSHQGSTVVADSSSRISSQVPFWSVRG
ncbi:hypothetical protein PBRA_000660 [Plasmodiophora brassicae]|uniref:COG complex component COG2 C-terminal domain-containing protein n=1 Tax=Plasmodiophora brassicae TaxID=37360 RepID=A0A0G4IQ31_PLABS|nr:hypothetical protein PBRA_000660 [Plasmodiophora brassicae]